MTEHPKYVIRPRWYRYRFALFGATVLLLAAGWWLGIDQEFLRFLLNWPGVAVALVGCFVIALGVSAQRRQTVRHGVALIGLGTLIGVGYLVRLSWWAAEFDRRLGEHDAPPAATFLPRRVLPYYVAGEFARRGLTDSRYALGSLEPTMAPDGRLVWQAPLLPNSVGTYFTHGVRELVEVDADTTRPDVRRIALALPRGGEGNFASFYRLIARTIDPLAEMQEPVYDTRARAALVPLLRWVWGIPSFHAVVRFDSQGRVRVLTPAEAADAHPHLRLVPEQLVYWQASRWGSWRRGPFGWITKRGLFEIAATGSNPAPTLLDNDRQGSWVVPMEPQGESFGLAGVLFVDAQSGAEYWWNTAGRSVASPSQALKVAVDDPRIALLKNAVPAEPKLAVLDGQIHYLVPIMPPSASQVQKLVVVDATTSRTVLGDGFDEVWAGVRGAASARAASASVAPSIETRLEAMAQTVASLQAQLDSLRALVAERR